MANQNHPISTDNLDAAIAGDLVRRLRNEGDSVHISRLGGGFFVQINEQPSRFASSFSGAASLAIEHDSD